VKRRDGNEVKRGVVFIREIVPRWAIAIVARTFYNENYVMSHHFQSNDNRELVVRYAWKSVKNWSRIGLTVRGEAALPQTGSDEQFITEHYWGYAAQKNGSCIEYQVAHPAWKVWSSVSISVEGDISRIYGKDFSEVLRNAPVSAFLAEGSAITVSRGRRI
jgi:hypothetical protein